MNGAGSLSSCRSLTPACDPLPDIQKQSVFDVGVEHCVCSGQLKVLAAIEEPVVIVRILTHLGLPARAPPRAPSLNHVA